MAAYLGYTPSNNLGLIWLLIRLHYEDLACGGRYDPQLVKRSSE